VEHLFGPKEVAYEADELVVVCLVRDGKPYVKSFLEHYASMGVKHMVFLDNGSTDGTVEALKEYDNVTVLRTALPFKRYALLVRQYLIERFGRGRWCLCVDIDELFDYPYSDVVGLSSLLRYLNERSYTAVVAHMLDMFPEEPLSGGRTSELPYEPLKERHRFYDLSNISRISMRGHPLFRNNTLESDEVEALRGGIRQTLFGFRANLTKLPLVFSDGRVKPFDGSTHWVDNARVADLTCVLFHYKFLNGYLQEQAVQAVREEHHYDNSAEYKKYLEVLEGNPTLRVKQETAREIESVNDLLENEFLVVSEDYVGWVNAEEEKSVLLWPAFQGKQHGLAEALLKARRQERTKTLKMRSLERRLLKQDLKIRSSKQNQRLLKKRIRMLERQLQGMRSSRGWRLLNKLGGIRARVSMGRKRQ
jgi:glycosyl transferase family 2